MRRLRIRRLVPIVLLLGAFAFVSSVWANRTDPATISQDVWYEMGTNSLAGSMRGLPKKHEVVVEGVDESWVKLLASYLPPPIGLGGKSEIQGRYEPETGVIRITGRLARAQAGLPSQAQGLFRHALRHEYGHAFADDWRKAKKVKLEPFLGYTESGRKTEPKGLPKEMAPVVKEYMNAPANLYGPAYLTQSFDEYLAESYARFMDGIPIPPETEKFFKKLAQD